jgi:cytochrome b561
MAHSPQQYGPVAIAFHWSIAAAVVLTVGLALYLENLELGDTKTLMLTLHKSVGITIFVLTWARIVWRLTHRPPALPGTMSPLQRLAATATHVGLYALTIAMPITGYISVAARGRETTFFDLFVVPSWVPLDRALSNLTETVHRYGQYAVYALVGLHVAAALYHHFVKRDGLLRRMWPGQPE